MTTTSAKSTGYLDLFAFGLDTDALRSISVLDDIWRDAVLQALPERDNDPVLKEFIEVSSGLVLFLADPDWQKYWLAAWHKQASRGFRLTELMTFFYRAVEICEHRILGTDRLVARLNVDLFSLLRRSVLAAVSATVELDEEARLAESGIPGELAALQYLHQALKQGLPVSLLSVSLINRNAFAHLSAGELQTLPALFAERLAHRLRPQDLVFSGREGEWLLVFPGVSSMVQPSLAGAHIQQSFAEPIRLISGRSIALDVAMGAAMGPEHGADADALVQAARLARWDLARTRQGFGWYHRDLHCDWQQHDELAAELKLALHQESFQFYLQPQVDINSGVCFGAEMLLRWQRENGEWVAPPLILELLEENGWRQMFTDSLIRHALRSSAELEAAGVPVRLSLNLTAADMVDTDLPDMIAQRLETWQIPGDRFMIELTESAMMADQIRCLSVMERLSDLGIGLALDDFGTGYSSLSYLVNLPFREIKIDRSFITAMARSPDSLRVVRTIIDLTHDLDMVPLAEGVEDPAQLEQLRSLGCDQVQGYLYARPMPLAEFIQWMQARPA
ncbi:EAL domain-containing protein [Dechloromonas denitrificans]|uniref:putative bifunctional diguanylate cyclase/phosphodiesterase n=1 Tax=Dechloromonas denitrificans TaxID=281362 RepID=UPI001CF8B1A9|nr:GGDEF domain-containing phosphodiesterase [Dechloromonas denitrificans]UCV11284.1 EAL domain-containing protein [Dechloromonas denitrificans]